MAGAAGLASIGVQGGGASLPALPYSPDYPVRFQLINSETGVCWEDSFDGTDRLRFSMALETGDARISALDGLLEALAMRDAA